MQTIVNNSPKPVIHIDALRGLEILLVIIVHTSQSISNLNKYIQYILNFGKIGVQLFFFLSAYTLCLSMDRNKQITSFYLRRYFRIAPLYYFGILFYSFNHQYLTNTLGPYNLPNLTANLLLLHGAYPSAMNNIVPGGWSIGTECLFYLWFPFIFSMYNRINKITWLLVPPVVALITAIVFIIIVEKVLGIDAYHFEIFYYNLINQLPVFLTGISFYFMRKKGSFIYSKKTSFILLPLLMLTSFFTSLLSRDLTIYPFITGLAFVFLFDLFEKQSKLNQKILIKLGKLSFSIYIIHFIFAYPLTRYIDLILDLNPYYSFFTNLCISVIGSYTMARITNRVIENPGIRIGKKLIKELRLS